VRFEIHAAANCGRTITISSGSQLSERVHREVVRTPEGEVGCFLVDLFSPYGGRLSRADREVLASVASSLAVAIHNQIRRRERDEAHHATVFALARLAEQRDDTTGKHIERVAEYCRLAAEGMREDGKHREPITDQFIEDLVRSSPLHDIGKVGIPDAILLKPGKLTDEEWVTMKQHTTIGAETLRNIIKACSSRSSFLEMGLEIAWCHHEKWDGNGYPRGLSGSAIPLSARILALADCYDALTTRRPYKPPWSHGEAIDYLQRHAGTDYDPAVVEAFCSRAERVDAIRRRLADDTAT